MCGAYTSEQNTLLSQFSTFMFFSGHSVCSNGLKAGAEGLNDGTIAMVLFSAGPRPKDR